MPTSVSVSAEICPTCVKEQGLCAHHAKHVCPQLKQPAWYRLVGNTHYDTRRDESDEARRVRLRKERKRARGAQRLLAALQGAPMRNTSAREAA